MIRYQVEYEGQILTEPLSIEEALAIAIEENIDAFERGHLPLSEVTIASSKVCSQCAHFVSTEPFEDSDGQRYV